MKKQNIAGFSKVDDTANPQDFVSYLDAISSLNSIQAYKQQTFTRLEIQAGDRILDVGCGIGDDVRSLAVKVGNAGEVVGIDRSETMVKEAQSRSANLGLPVAYYVGDAEKLDFPDHTFDGCRSDRTFQHLLNPRQALAEIVRVTRSGGRVVVSEPDWETLVIDTGDRALTRKILNFHCDSCVNGWIGRQLPALFQEVGLHKINVNTYTLILTDCALADKHLGVINAAMKAQQAGLISIAEAANWITNLEAASQAGRFFCAITGFLAFGCKP
ncbi:class I SAM-dependent methyltransferase [Chlorogloeopsis sp. ULAP01]|uniref:class I SAM-dependent methyltransferase n=1 Tax=Chlorogloeopsis sp. ULAP01 TaxID=3056483 RepID=UPI0025AAD3CE|nr:class I SAM-dependent methyltransferase [Chlorogloeopsis sp. ULAP01]MDM9379428.1 class I SAM-dependent methyltransferase [Chlorogloeopsis sp. ULAP01]